MGRAFEVLPGGAHRPVNVCGLLVPQEYVKTFHIYECLILSFLFSLWLIYSLPQLLSTASGIMALKHVLINVSDRHAPTHRGFYQ